MTAVEWLIVQIKNDHIDKALKGWEWLKIFEQAKEMEKQFPQTEISDEDIEKEALSYFNEHHCNVFEYDAFIAGVKWYREQLKKKINGNK